jgi:flagellar biosynthesis/type III secretory pathway protein FliH
MHFCSSLGNKRQTKIICLSHLTAKRAKRKQRKEIVDVVVAVVEEVIGIWMTCHKNRYKDEL